MTVRVGVALVGIGEWAETTRPALDSLRAHEPSVRALVIDNGSSPAYPAYPGVEILRLERTVPYAAALNRAMRALDSDWALLCNNDVLFRRPFVERVTRFDPNEIYGFWQHDFHGRHYLSSWALILHQATYQKIGPFDERLAPMGLEDADYCMRAQALGVGLFGILRETFGIEHLPRRRANLPKESYEYLMEKYGIHEFGHPASGG